MAFLKYANVKVKKAGIHLDDWEAIQHSGRGGSIRVAGQAKPDISKYAQGDYLLTHCTIMASVDVEKVPGVKTGKVKVGSSTINRKWDDYYITPETARFINANGDCWDRQTLLNTYHTFVGAENYCEHVQIPELSKGKVIDAVARDTGDSVYIDILVATNRKHEQLIADIESGKMSTLSMGCSIAYSRCSKCGNVATDETNMCHCVKYEKGNTFIDEQGIKRVVAELCGSASDPDSVTFIEASWVANPAFKGAVLQKILNSDSNISEEERQAKADRYSEILTQHPMLAEFMQTSNMDTYLKSAAQEVFGKELDELKALREDIRQVFASKSVRAWGMDEEEEDTSSDEPEKFLETLKEEIKEKVQEDIKNDLVKQMEEDLGLGPKEPMFDGHAEKADLNDSIVNSFQVYASDLDKFQVFSDRYASELGSRKVVRNVYSTLKVANQEGWPRVKEIPSITNRDILAAIYLKDRDHSKRPLDKELYSTLSKVGGFRNYANARTFLRACALAMGRNPTKKEAQSLVRRASLLK